MDFLRKDPRSAYFSNVLWLPKSYVAEPQLRGALTYDLGKTKEPYVAFIKERDHYLVPRNYLLPEHLSALPFTTIDARIRSFPRVTFKSHVVLDFKNPQLSCQREGVAALLRTLDGVLSLRCGAGKTVCAVHAIHLAQTPALVLVNDKGLAAQWVNEILEFTDLREKDIGFIGDGEFRWQDKPITLALVQTVAGRVRAGKIPRELVEWFGTVVADEAHTTAGPAFFGQAVTPFHGRRWGLSATPRRNDGFDSLLRYTLGRVIYSYLEPELTPLIYFRYLPTKINLQDHAVFEAVTDVSGELHLQKLYSYLATRNDRMSAIIQEIKSALKQGRQALVLSQSRAVLERLEQVFPEAGIVHGGVDDRQERLRRIRECNPVIATSSLGRQALNKPKLDTLFVLEPFSDAGVLQQLLGRIQRQYNDKQQAMAVFYDDLHIERMHAICLKMRKLFSRWPDNQGGRLKWQNTGES